MSNDLIKIELDKIVKRQTKSYPFVELDESYIGEFLSQNNFLIIRYSNKLYYIHNYKHIHISSIDEYLYKLVNKEVDELFISIKKEFILEALCRKRNIANKNIVKYDLAKTEYNQNDESALKFLKFCKIL